MIAMGMDIEGKEMDTSGEEEDLQLRDLDLRRRKQPPSPSKKVEPTHPQQAKLRIYLRLPTEDQIMKEVDQTTNIRSLKKTSIEQLDMDPRTKLSIKYKSAKLPDGITIGGARISNGDILDVAYN